MNTLDTRSLCAKCQRLAVNQNDFLLDASPHSLKVPWHDLLATRDFCSLCSMLYTCATNALAAQEFPPNDVRSPDHLQFLYDSYCLCEKGSNIPQEWTVFVWLDSKEDEHSCIPSVKLRSICVWQPTKPKTRWQPTEPGMLRLCTLLETILIFYSTSSVEATIHAKLQGSTTRYQDAL